MADTQASVQPCQFVCMQEGGVHGLDRGSGYKHLPSPYDLSVCRRAGPAWGMWACLSRCMASISMGEVVKVQCVLLDMPAAVYTPW